MRKTVFSFFLLIPVFVFGAEQDSIKSESKLFKLPKINIWGSQDTSWSGFKLIDFPLYFESGIGIEYGTFRDFATSPLIYHGGVIEIPLSLQILDEKREMYLTMRNSIGAYTINIGNEEILAQGYVNNIRFSHLARIKKLSSERWNFKVGGVYDFTTIFRMNSALQNNALGYELFSTLSGSLKLSRDLSRKNESVVKLIWWPIHFSPRRRDLAYRLDIGLINSTVRNGYSYIGQELLLNNLVIFDGYKFSLFSGYRLGSQLDYTYYLKSNNGIRLSYIWDAYFTGGDLPRFEMAHHILQFSLLYKIK